MKTKMKFGVLQFFSWPERRIKLEEIYSRAFDRIELMDKTGYDAVWLAEHHFSTFSVCPSIHMIGAHIANRTRNLRIGTGVSLAPFYNPLRLAEEVALLDILSNGRVNWGVGRGHQTVEFKAFGVDPQDSYELFRENVEVVLKAWSNERLTHHGKFHQFDNLEVLPKPVQNPIPVWMAAASGESLSWAAEKGFSILMGPPLAHTQIGDQYSYYKKTMRKHGHSIAGRDIPMGRLICVDETREKAEATARNGARWYIGSYDTKDLRPVHVQSALNEAHAKSWNPPMSSGGKSLEARTQSFLDDVVIWGSPEMVIDKIEQLREEISLDYLLLSPLSHQTLLSFTEKVLPHFQ